MRGEGGAESIEVGGSGGEGGECDSVGASGVAPIGAVVGALTIDGTADDGCKLCMVTLIDRLCGGITATPLAVFKPDKLSVKSLVGCFIVSWCCCFSICMASVGNAALMGSG